MSVHRSNCSNTSQPTYEIIRHRPAVIFKFWFQMRRAPALMPTVLNANLPASPRLVPGNPTIL